MKNYCILHEVNQWAGPARCPVSICVASSQMIWRTPYSRRFLTRPDSNDPERSSRSPIASLPDRDRIQASSRASQLRASASARRSLSPTRHVRSLGPGPAMLRSGASVWATGTSEWPLSYNRPRPTNPRPHSDWTTKRVPFTLATQRRSAVGKLANVKASDETASR